MKAGLKIALIPAYNPESLGVKIEEPLVSYGKNNKKSS